ncbi:hypothetical protein Barb4_00348 [Bacteroidales bacterium Barb4]|nr:hypothetical protein Barb4_00348 [Bacteroidales bacterium Barb4]
MEKSVSQAEEEIKNLTESNETLYEQHKRLCTPEGTGDKTAVKMIVVTRGFTDARKFCCHAGAAPFSRSFRTPLAALFHNPTFRYAPCGAEIFCPFGTFCKP